MKRQRILRYFNDIISIDDRDPIEGEMKLVSSVQQWVGIRNVFGDKRRSFTVMSVFAVLLFAGTFFYVGIFSQLVYLAQVFPDKLETFKAINCLCATSVPFSKYIFMWTARSRLKSIFKMSREGLSSIPTGSSARRRMLSTLQKARFASWFVVINQAASHIVYLLMPFLFTAFGNDRYLPTTPGDSYGLTPKYESPFYEITFVLTTTATCFSAINQTGYIVLFIILLAHELGHFYAITQTLNDIYEKLSLKDKIDNENDSNVHITNAIEENKKDDDAKDMNVNEMLKFCIKHHQFLIKYHNEIRQLYKMIFGAHFLMMTFLLVTTLQTLTAWDVRNTILTGITGILPLFLYCFGGELLIISGTEMSTAVYNCGWELMDVKQAKMVLLMLCTSQRPLFLTAADLFVMNRETFGNIAQVVYKIYAVFN